MNLYKTVVQTLYPLYMLCTCCTGFFCAIYQYSDTNLLSAVDTSLFSTIIKFHVLLKMYVLQSNIKHCPLYHKTTNKDT